jgi:catechol 2,3-dioxygenase
MTDTDLHVHICVGHVHLWVSDLDRAITFYQDVIGLHVTEDMRNAVPPRRMAFLAAGDYHHHVGLRERKTPVSNETTGLFHFALLYPDRQELARALQRILDQGYPVDSVLDYGVSEAVNLSDPDGNGIELTYDRPPDVWPRSDGQLRFLVKKLDRDDLLGEVANKET